MIKIIPVVVGILKQNNRFLIAKRPAQVVMAGYWEFPGGKVEAQESQETALARELHEEIGIQVLTSNFLTQFIFTFPDRTIELNVWEVLSYEGIPYGKENQELQWASTEEFEHYSFLPSNSQLLDFLCKK